MSPNIILSDSLFEFRLEAIPYKLVNIQLKEVDEFYQQLYGNSREISFDDDAIKFKQQIGILVNKYNELLKKMKETSNFSGFADNLTDPRYHIKQTPDFRDKLKSKLEEIYYVAHSFKNNQ